MELNTIQALSCKVEKGATGIHYFKDDEIAEITTADKELMARIRAISKRKGVVIDQEPCKENGGFMLALVPIEYLLAEPKPKIKRNLTPEQRKKRSEQMRKINEQKKANS
ncbi:MAG: hypothetical protein J6S85_11540 [Methanobrevibacter sp.]|nr:hypothetical protein [Methanobrevibacter sp.]